MERTILLFFSLFSLFTEAAILWQYTSSLFIPSYSDKFRLASVGISYTILFLLSLPGQTRINIISFFVLNTAILYTLFQLKLLSAFFHSAILTTIRGISEFTVLRMIAGFFPHFPLESDKGLVIHEAFSKILYFVVIYLFVYFFKIKKTDQEQYSHSELLLMSIPVSSVFIMLTFLTFGETLSFAPPVDFMVTICSVFPIMTNLFVFAFSQYNQRKNREFTGLQLLLQKEAYFAEYYEMLLSQSENQSILIHDINKHLQSIKLLNEKGDREKINSYICQLIEASDLKEASKICDNEMLNAILCRYQRRCAHKHILFHADIRSGVIQTICQHDLTSLFCNLLDNAIESAENIPGSFIELTVRKKNNSSYVVIVMINSCQNTPLYDKDGLPVSHKANKTRHGFGIKSIQKVVEQYLGNLQMYYDNDSNTFHTVITLKQTQGKHFLPSESYQTSEKF